MREVFSIGIWSTIRSITTMIPTRVTPLLVGSLLGVSLVAPLSIAARLIATASAILVAATGVITPIATALHAREERGRQQQLLLEGGKYSLAAATVVLALFLLLGRPLIQLWVGPEMALAYPLLALMALGRWVSMSQVVTRGVITAQAKHRALALSSLVQAVVTLSLALAGLRPWGVIGVVAAVAVGDAVCEGLFSLIYGCRLLGMSAVRYAARIASATAVALALPCGLLAAVTWWRPVSGWLDLILYGGVFSLLSVGAVLWYNERPSLAWPGRLRRAEREMEEIRCAT
jgi:membrane protein EpsK